METNIFYCLMIKYLVNNYTNPTRNADSFYFAKEQLKINAKNDALSTWIELIEKSFEDYQLLTVALPANKKMGWIRIAFSYAVYFLVKGTSFRDSMKKILLLKGDTDTNACIAGGLFGAYYGYNKLEMKKEIEKIEIWRPKNVKRPNWMVPGLTIEKGVTFLKSSSNSVKIIGG